MLRAPTILAGLLTAALAAGSAPAQKGTGEAAGVARETQPPPLVDLSGTLRKIHTGPCQLTTGKAVDGAHLLLATPEGRQIDLHLGPHAAMAALLQRLEVDQTMAAEAFRTARMPEDTYIARRLSVDGERYTLRDSNLRPLWRVPGSGRSAGRGRGAAEGDVPRCWWSRTPQ
jgi:hypothetical protein